MLQEFFHSERCGVRGEKAVKEKYKDNTCTSIKYYKGTVGLSSYTDTLPVDGVSSFKFK